MVVNIWNNWFPRPPYKRQDTDIYTNLNCITFILVRKIEKYFVIPSVKYNTTMTHQYNQKEVSRLGASVNEVREVLDTQINQKEAELQVFIEEKSREIGLTQLKEQLKCIQKICKHKNSHCVERISHGYGDFENRYHCSDCDKRWSE